MHKFSPNEKMGADTVAVTELAEISYLIGGE